MIFDRQAVRLRRDRAAQGFDTGGFLVDEVADRLADRLLDIKRDFPTALDLGCHTGAMGRAVGNAGPGGGAAGGIRTLVQADLSPAMASRAGALALAADEEFLPFREESFDLVLSCLSLHWVNDLPGTFIQINRALRPDGLFLGAMLGGDTLVELRECLIEAELAVTGGASPRLSPLTDLRDAGGLLQRAQFALPVIDSDRITVTYDNALALMADLRRMGETNAVIERTRKPLSRAVLMQAAQLYQDRFAGPDGRIPATFQVIYLHGWAPHASQPKPLRPGSAKTRLADALGVTEHKT